MSPWTEHGGRLARARSVFDSGGLPWIDLSTGINPQPWPGVERLTIDWARLPEADALADLEAAAARYFGADPQCVMALPGTEIGLRLLGECLPKPARYRWPSYRTHAEMAPGAIPIAPEAPDAHEGTLILANPNNPDGRVTPADTLRTQMAKGWLVVDEAFADPDPYHSLAHQVGADRRLIVLRSFGKFFGLAGVRLGFLLAPPERIAEFRARVGAWPVSAAAIAIGAAAYRDSGWIEAMRAGLPRQAAALDRVLEKHGFAPTGECPLFRLIETENAPALFDRLARRAILTRPFDNAPHWLRVGLPPDAAALERLDTALANG